MRRQWTVLLTASLSFFSASAFADSVITQIASQERYPLFEQRHHLLHQMNRQEIREHAGKLFEFLAMPQAPQGMLNNDFLSLKNDIFDRLLQQDGRYTNDLLRLIHSVITDDSADFVWRDYCMQKIAMVLTEHSENSGAPRQTLEMLEDYAAGKVAGLQGTALIVSVELEHDLADADKGWLDRKTISEYAVGCIESADAALIDQVTAFQVLAKLGAGEGLRLARALLTPVDFQEPPMLIASAIAAVGQLGDTSDLALLTEYRNSGDIRFRTSARVAIERITKL